MPAEEVIDATYVASRFAGRGFPTNAALPFIHVDCAAPGAAAMVTSCF
jgi:hypothetical protein